MTNPATGSFTATYENYCRLNKRCDALDGEIAFFLRKAERLSSCDGYSDALELCHLRKHLEVLTCASRKVCDSRMEAANELRLQLSALKDERLRVIMEYRYLEGQRWRQISELTCLDLRWVYRLHKKALNSLSQ